MSIDQPPPETKPLKSGCVLFPPNGTGKVFGTIALLCGLEPVVMLGCGFLVYLTPADFPNMSPWYGTFVLLGFLSVPSFFGGIFFGLLGTQTEGWLPAWIGLICSLFYGLLLLSLSIVHLIFPGWL